MLDLSIADVHDAEARLQRFAPLLEQLFPELKPSSGKNQALSSRLKNLGIIESELLSIPSMWDYLKNQDSHLSGSLLLKADHSLPVAGTICTTPKLIPFRIY